MIFITAFYVLFLIRELVAIQAQLGGLNYKCEIQCSTIRDLESRISSLERSVRANDRKIVEFVSLQHSFQRMEDRVNYQAREIGNLKKTVPQQAQNLTALFEKVGEMKVEKADVLRTTIEDLQEKFQEQKHMSSSLKTQLDEINGNSSAERKRTAEALKIISDKMIAQSSNHSMSLEGFKQEIESVELTIAPLNSSINTLYKVQSAFNQTLSANQQNIDDLKGDFLNITDTLTIYQQKFTNLGTELQRSFTIGQQQLYENLTAQMDISNHYFDNAIAGVFSKLNELANEMNILRMNLSNLGRDITIPFPITEPPSIENYNHISPMESENNDDTSPYKITGEVTSERNSCPLPRHIGAYYLATITPTGLRPLNYRLHLIPNGTKLRFGCHDPGRSVLIDPESKELIMSNYTLECTNGNWEGGNFPDCQRHRDANEMRSISDILFQQIRGAESCQIGEEQFTVTEYDCSKYVLCSRGRLELHECPSPLVFNLSTGYCRSPSHVDCSRQKNDFKQRGIAYLFSHPHFYFSETQINSLSKLFPIIRLNPDRRNEPNSFMANGAIGELVVYPQSNVTLECQFPILSQPIRAVTKWKVNYFEPSHYEKLRETFSRFSSFLKLELLRESDSGIYTCVAPNGRRTDFEILVRAITCPLLKQFAPDIVMEADYETHVNARSIPMTTEVTYRCPLNHTYSKPKTIFCTAFGYWSKSPYAYSNDQLDLCKKSRYLGEERIGYVG